MAAQRYVEEYTFKRKYPRFNIAHYDGLSAQVEGQNTERVISLGQGGCGFYSLEGPDGFVPPKKVSVTFSFDNHSLEPIQVQGEVIYVRPYNIQNKVVYYFGVEFGQAFQSKLDGLAQELDRWAEEGKVIRI